MVFRRPGRDGNYDIVVVVMVVEEGSPITLDFPEYIFNDAIKYRMNDGATFEGRNIGVTWWTRNLLLGRARPITRRTSPPKNLCLFSVRYWKGEPRITGCLDV